MTTISHDSVPSAHQPCTHAPARFARSYRTHIMHAHTYTHAQAHVRTRASAKRERPPTRGNRGLPTMRYAFRDLCQNLRPFPPLLEYYKNYILHLDTIKNDGR